MATLGAGRRLTPHDGLFLPLFGGTLLLAWCALGLFQLSPYGRYLDHDWTADGAGASICSAVAGGELVVPAVLYVGGWVLMTAAMMLPTTLPLVGIFRRLVAGNPGRGLLLALLLAGYLATWLVFGITAHGMGVILAGLVSRSPWLSLNGWLLGAAIFLIAGLFQFSGLKRRCLDACRTPLHFVLGRWRGLRPRLESLRLGWAHGVYCVGCCWALMLLMFVVGTGSIGWMLGLGAVMALEKNSPSGQALGTALGLLLILVSVAIVAGHAGRTLL